jgi:cysteine-rich repeat protein
MRVVALAPLLLALPIALSAASCGRSTLGSLTTAEEGGGGAGGGTTTSSTTSTTGTTTSSTTTTAPGECGNGIVQDPEQCDDGNTSNSDACLSNCTLAFCGDGIVHVGFEQCDDGNQSSNDDCVSCAVAFCGDGFLHAGFEECDDGNLDNNDSCNSLCKLTGGTCGNGVLDPGEECDDGNASNTEQCLNGCFKAFCGDGFVMTGVEECDDGNGANGDNCLPTCKSAKCGDGVVHVGVEPCDDGNASNTDACLTTCQKASCGDGFVQAGVEQCDDGNVIDGDGCSSTCQLAVCGNGTLDPGEACDLGAMNADRPAFLLTFQNQSQGAEPIVSPADASLFYNYFSASGHTGFEILDGSILFLYADSTTKALSLFVEHGIDFTTTGLSQASGHITMDITGLPASAVVALSDDTPSEFFKLSATSVHGDWSFQQNTDGGVVSGLPFPGNWTLNVTPTLPANFKWQFEDGGSMPTPVVMGGPSAQIQAFDTPSACRKNCSVPKCGDGVLDGGEVCDDGNVVSGDGCAADCKGF